MRLVFDDLERRAAPGETVRFPVSLHNEATEPVECDFQLQAEESGVDLSWCRLPAPAFLPAHARRRDRLTGRLPDDAEPGTYHLWLTARTRDGSSTAGAGCTLIVRSRPCARFSAMPQFTLNPDGTVTASLTVFNCGDVQLDASVTLRHEDGWHFEPEDPQLTLHAGRGPVQVEFTYRPPDGKRATAEDDVTIEIRAGNMLLASKSGRLQSAWQFPYRWVVAALTLIVLALLTPWALSQPSSDGPPSESGTTRAEPPATEEPRPPAPPPPNEPSSPAAPDVDLLITELTTETITIQNIGEDPAGPFDVHLDYVRTELPDEETFSVPDGLEAGETRSRQFACADEVAAEIDPAGSVPESNEENNADFAGGSCTEVETSSPAPPPDDDPGGVD